MIYGGGVIVPSAALLLGSLHGANPVTVVRIMCIIIIIISACICVFEDKLQSFRVVTGTRFLNEATIREHMGNSS